MSILRLARPSGFERHVCRGVKPLKLQKGKDSAAGQENLSYVVYRNT
jgi:hypothetical protein